MRADRGDNVFRLGDRAAVNRQHLCDERHTRAQVLADKGGRCDIFNDDTRVGRKHPLFDHASGRLIGRDLFSALRVNRVQAAHLNAAVVLCQTAQHLDRLGLVVLNGDLDLCNTDIFFDRLNTVEHILRTLDDRAVVGCYVRLAFGRVDNERIHLREILGIQLDVRGETGAAQADKARLLDRLHKFGMI